MTGVETSGNRLTIRRTFDAPRERVWRAFTDSDELERWFAPEGMTAEVRANELEPGGEMSIRWTDGENHIDNDGYYVEVVEHERLVSGEETEDGELRLVYEFTEVEAGTEVVITQEFPGPVPDGADEGWAAILDTLEEVLRTMTHVETTAESLTIRRTFDASPARVFDAWTDPEQVDRWWGPDGFTTETDEMDVRPGGVWEFTMTGPDGEAYPNRVVFEEVEEPERLAYTHGSPDDPEQFRVTVTFDEREDGTELTMRMRFPSPDALDEAVEFGADDGAVQTLDRLADHLANGSTEVP